MSIVTRRLHLSGHVQGVGFRMAVQREAVRLGLRGYVRNLSDGGVEILAQGTLDVLSEIESWCYSSAHGATVRHVHGEDVSRSLIFWDFAILS